MKIARKVARVVRSPVLLRSVEYHDTLEECEKIGLTAAELLRALRRKAEKV